MKDFLIEKIDEIAFSTVEPNDKLWESEILDSITVVELAVEIENEFGIKIPFDEIVVENFETVNLLIDYINRKLSK
jgi:acyl carrier protein